MIVPRIPPMIASLCCQAELITNDTYNGFKDFTLENLDKPIEFSVYDKDMGRSIRYIVSRKSENINCDKEGKVTHFLCGFSTFEKGYKMFVVSKENDEYYAAGAQLNTLSPKEKLDKINKLIAEYTAAASAKTAGTMSNDEFIAITNKYHADILALNSTPSSWRTTETPHRMADNDFLKHFIIVMLFCEAAVQKAVDIKNMLKK